MRRAEHRRTPTVFDVVHRAVEICDPDGHDEALAEFLRRFEDNDEPVSALGRDREREFFEVAGELEGDRPDSALTMAAAVATYLAYRRDEIDDDAYDILRLAARAEFGTHVPSDVVDWLAERGVTV
jgi:hypothetical protein